MSSRDAVNIVQRRLRGSAETKKVKVGHCGTLDPLAEGVLVLGVGPAVRLVPYVHQQSKRYRGKFLLGQSSPTGDLEMAATRHDELPIPSREDLQTFAGTMIGEIRQTPPAYSAVWVDGKRAYDRVRGGEDVQMPTRTVFVHSLNIVNYQFPELELEIECGSGTYIRTIGMDLAEGVGSRAVMSYLQRVSVGAFNICDAVTTEQLRQDDLRTIIQPARLAVEHLPQRIVDEEMSTRLMNGLCLEDEVDRKWDHDSEIAAMNADGQLRAILRWKRERWCPYRVFSLQS